MNCPVKIGPGEMLELVRFGKGYSMARRPFIAEPIINKLQDAESALGGL